MACFTLNGAIGQAPFDIQLQAAAKTPVARLTPQGGNPMWGIPIGSLSATRERPVFSASRRLPAPLLAPVPVAEAPPPKLVEPEQPPFTLVGTAIGKPQNVALIFEQTTKNLVRLHVGEVASGWYLRSVDLRAMTLEKNSQTVTLNFPARVSAR
jgi:general secretion pathway protein N